MQGRFSDTIDVHRLLLAVLRQTGSRAARVLGGIFSIPYDAARARVPAIAAGEPSPDGMQVQMAPVGWRAVLGRLRRRLFGPRRVPALWPPSAGRRVEARPDPFKGRHFLPTLLTERFVVRPLVSSDAAAIFEIFSDPAVTRFWGFSTFEKMADAEAFVAETRRGFHTRSLFEWGVAEREGGPVVGTCALTAWSPAHRRAEIGFALRRDRWGEGVMAEVLPAVIRFGFGPMRLNRIEADVDPRNEPSIRRLERLGFQREGYLRQRYVVNGDVQDAIVYALLREDWAGGPVAAA